MAAVATNMKSSLHSRSNSLPSSSHPVVSQAEEHLLRLKDSEATFSLSSSSSISHKLNGLLDLQDSIDKLLQLTITQQVLAQECSDKKVDELLDGSLRLLDACNIVKDCLQQSKDGIQELQSVIRRRRDAEAGLTIEGGKYLASRKKMKKSIQKTLGYLKGMKNDEFTVSSSDKDNETFSVLSILKEAEAVTVSSLESLLLFISGPKGQSKKSKWSLVSKLVQPKRVACDSEASDTNEFEKVDAVLQSLISSKPYSVENLQSNMQDLELCIEDIEVVVEHLSRQLIRTRVSLLNILNH